MRRRFLELGPSNNATPNQERQMITAFFAFATAALFAVIAVQVAVAVYSVRALA